ncbi:ankyrin repeat domain-containing protein [Barrientosiimonas humi]|uniref:ankyrin repeat domain-containing protein n=1 Tax=Barrientosiimonas humi TaxID=999931 RepID=UPI00370D9A43
MNRRDLLGLLALTLVAGCSAGGSGGADPAASGSAGTSRTPSPAPVTGRDDEALRQAARRDDVPTAQRLIAAGSDVNAKDAGGESAYLITTADNAPGVLELTLRNGARINDLDSWNGTGLIRAAERGHAQIVGRLLRAGISKDHVNRIGYQAIHEVVWLGADDEGHIDTTRVLVAGGVQLDRPSGNERLTPLQMARERGYRTIEATLAAASTATRPTDPDAELVRAAAAGRPDQVALALRAGADLAARDGRGRTAWVASQGREDVRRLLRAMGASPGRV